MWRRNAPHFDATMMTELGCGSERRVLFAAKHAAQSGGSALSQGRLPTAGRHAGIVRSPRGLPRHNEFRRSVADVTNHVLNNEWDVLRYLNDFDSVDINATVVLTDTGNVDDIWIVIVVPVLMLPVSIVTVAGLH